MSAYEGLSIIKITLDQLKKNQPRETLQNVDQDHPGYNVGIW